MSFQQFGPIVSSSGHVTLTPEEADTFRQERKDAIGRTRIAEEAAESAQARLRDLEMVLKDHTEDASTVVEQLQYSLQQETERVNFFKQQLHGREQQDRVQKQEVSMLKAEVARLRLETLRVSNAFPKELVAAKVELAAEKKKNIELAARLKKTKDEDEKNLLDITAQLNEEQRINDGLQQLFDNILEVVKQDNYLVLHVLHSIKGLEGLYDILHKEFH